MKTWQLGGGLVLLALTACIAPPGTGTVQPSAPTSPVASQAPAASAPSVQPSAPSPVPSLPASPSPSPSSSIVPAVAPMTFGPQVKLIGGVGERGDFTGVTNSGLPERRFFDTAEAVVPMPDGRIAFLEGGRGRIGVWSLPFVRPSAEPYRIPAEMMTGFKQARDMVAYKDGFLVSDAQAHQVFFVKSDGSKRVFAGTGVPGGQGEGGAATAAQLDTPVGLAVDSKGNAYIADSGNHAIRKVGDDGTIQTVAGALGVPAEAGSFKAGGPLLRFPSLIAFDAQDTIHVYDGRFQIRRYAPTKQFDLIAGTGTTENYNPADPRPGVGLGPVLDMVFGPDNLLYYADAGNHVIRRLDPSLPWDKIKADTLVGSGKLGVFPYQDAAPLEVTVDRPTALAFDKDGNLIYFEGATFRWLLAPVNKP